MNGKKSYMTEGQRVISLLKREKPDRVPLWPFFDMTGFAAVYHNRPIIDAYSDAKISLEMQRKVCQDFNWICSPFFPAFGAADFGGKIKLPDSEFSQAPSTTVFPIESEDDISKLKMPDLTKSIGIVREEEFYRLSAQDRPENQPFKISLILYANPFEWAGRLCRPELLNRWILKKPDTVHRLLRLMVDVMTEVMNYWYNAFGTEDVLVMSGGVICSNQLISPRQFAQFVLPTLKEFHQKVLDKGYKHIYCHVCGEQNLNMPHWQYVPMGNPGIVGIGHEVALEKAAEYFPKDIILGNLEPAILQTKSPEEVYNATRDVIQRGKKLPGGFIFSTGCQFPPRASLENVRAMNKAVDDFGWYE